MITPETLMHIAICCVFIAAGMTVLAIHRTEEARP